MSSDLETKIATLKSELKAINSEYAKIKEIPAEKRAEFGKQINEKKQAAQRPTLQPGPGSRAYLIQARPTGPGYMCIKARLYIHPFI